MRRGALAVRWVLVHGRLAHAWVNGDDGHSFTLCSNRLEKTSAVDGWVGVAFDARCKLCEERAVRHEATPARLEEIGLAWPDEELGR